MSDYTYLDSNGVIVPDTSAVQGEVNTFYQNTFGSDIVLTPDTPQGLLATADVLTLTSVINNNAQIANQINPSIAGGSFLDAIMAFLGQSRVAATQTLVTNVTLTGIAGTIIPANSQASTSAGDIFLSASDVTLSSGGTAQVNFYSQSYGAIPCASSALTNVVSSVLGWETVLNNPASSPASVTTLGQALQSDQQARALRQNTLAFQGVALPLAITSALYNVSGVTSLVFLENYESSPAGMLISVTGGSTLSGTIWGMTTTTGTGLNGTIIVGTDDINFAASLQDLPVINPWPIAAYTTTGNISLSGLTTQAGGDWASGLSAGDIILAKNQTTASENGVWLAASGAWVRQSYNTSGNLIYPSQDGISL
ncbi:MAG: baseplate J/gp47 family protein, partial [Patescibacteria group bacterium]|nr:baseplate J/gp47 family protein [Patescibacteria group bacterium]